tara:strand:- start:247 stop:807 length:561 start_codon:yes stop_codon:yes gene_type:complete
MQSVNPTAGSVGITELNVSDGSNGQALTTNGSGTLSFASTGANTPNFHVKLTSNQSITSNTLTLVAFDTTTFDTDSGWSGASDYKWTVPSGKAGKYAISVKLDNYTGSNDMTKHQMELYKNGAREVSQYWQIGSDQTFRHFPLGFSYLANLSVGDYLQVYTKIVATSPQIKGDEKGAYFEAFRLVE